MSQQINLLEPSLLPRRDWFNAVNILVGLGLAGTLLTGHWVFESVAMSRLMESSMQSHATTDPAPSQVPLDEMERELTVGQDRLTRGETLMQAVAGLTDLPIDNAGRMRWLINALPETAWLQEVEFVGRNGVRIVGGSIQADALAGFSQRLGAHPAFKGIPIQSFAFDARDREEPGVNAAASKDGTPYYGFVVSSVVVTSSSDKEVRR